jgi:iron transport multicopper oxidase
VPDGLNPNATASIMYSSSNSLTDLSPMPLEFYQHTDDTLFVPSIVEPQLPPPDKVVELEVVFDTMDDGTNHAMFNSKTFNMPKVPTLLTQTEYAAQNISAFKFFSGHSTARLIGELYRRDGFR